MSPARAAAAGDPWDELRVAAAGLELELPPSFESHARAYVALVGRWERIGRLTGYATLRLRVRHLLIESLMLLRVVPPPGTPLLDIGSGPGVPGLIVKLARPAWEVTLLEATRRRANFLRDVQRQLGLPGLSVAEGRAEDLAATYTGRFATVTMRAVSGPAEAGRLAAPFLRAEGSLVHALGPAASPRQGRVEAVSLPISGELPLRRRFLIIRRTELDRDVPRGTYRTAGTHDRHRQPEGWRRQDHDGR